MIAATMTYRPIGVIHSPFSGSAETPIQGACASDAEGLVEVFEEFAEGLRDVELFSHLYLLYHFHQARPPSLLAAPYLEHQLRGIFAIRAPCRPNPIGLSIVRLLSREGPRLRVAELDVLDGTPLLDIKPYVALFDRRPTANSGWLTSAHLGRPSGGADSGATK